MHWQPPEHSLPPEADAPSGWDRWMRPLYWLAGARWETLQFCPATERERVAVLGSTVLIPTIMSFLGMIFYAKSRFAEPPWLAVLGIALAWAFVIMNTDRILLATYRPFQPWWRKVMQVAFRFALAGVVSVAIAFPFCLDQYRSAITHRYQTEIQGKLNNLREEEAAKRKELAVTLEKIRDDEAAARKQLTADYTTEHDALTTQLPDLQKAILNPEVYADERMEEERKKASAPEFVAPASGATRAVIAQIEAQKETLAKTSTALKEKQDLHQRLVEATAREVAGQPNEFYPETKKAGEGPRTKDLVLRDKSVTADIRRHEAAEKAQQEALIASDKQLSAARITATSVPTIDRFRHVGADVLPRPILHKAPERLLNLLLNLLVLRDLDEPVVIVQRHARLLEALVQLVHLRSEHAVHVFVLCFHTIGTGTRDTHASVLSSCNRVLQLGLLDFLWQLLVQRNDLALALAERQLDETQTTLDERVRVRGIGALGIHPRLHDLVHFVRA